MHVNKMGAKYSQNANEDWIFREVNYYFSTSSSHTEEKFSPD